jgi:hypothetical protein
LVPSKRARSETALLEALERTAWAEVVPAKLLLEQLRAVYDPLAAFDLGFGWETPAALAHGLEKNGISSKS